MAGGRNAREILGRMENVGRPQGCGLKEDLAVVDEARTVTFVGAQGLVLAADEWGSGAEGSVLLLHGGGQTRHSWKAAGAALAAEGRHVVALDLRGHGDSQWSPDADYDITFFRDDLLAVLTQVATPAILVGASLGGITALLATADRPDLVERLVLVDIATRLEADGVERIHAFMHSAPNGFASLEEAADAVADYLPHRDRPRRPEGLRKNLRLRDGRWYWHWDPRLFSSERRVAPEHAQATLDAAARAVEAPTLLLAGGQSDVLSDEGVEHLRTVIPHVEVRVLGEAAHTAAADDNDAFTAAVADFIRTA
ncbi:MAG: alpha/beta hydrolase [Tetrasphaera sp.]